MTIAFAYQSELFCEDCAKSIREKLNPELVALADKDRNSDMAPQGPYPDGGGEADTPQHCDACDVFLKNPLTGDGRMYVQKIVDREWTPTVVEWSNFYDIYPAPV